MNVDMKKNFMAGVILIDGFCDWKPFYTFEN